MGALQVETVREGLARVVIPVTPGSEWRMQYQRGEGSSLDVLFVDVCTSDDPRNHQGDTCPIHETERS